jgi:plasmid stability protein
MGANMNLSLKTIPPALHRQLKEKSAEHGRSLSKEILSTLELAVRPRVFNEEDFLDQVRKKRRKFKLNLTIEKIESAIHEGRQ